MIKSNQIVLSGLYLYSPVYCRLNKCWNRVPYPKHPSGEFTSPSLSDCVWRVRRIAKRATIQLSQLSPVSFTWLYQFAVGYYVFQFVFDEICLH